MKYEACTDSSPVKFSSVKSIKVAVRKSSGVEREKGIFLTVFYFIYLQHPVSTVVLLGGSEVECDTG